MDDLSGKVAVITGAAGGIGSALALTFSEVGMKIVLADLEGARLKPIEDQLAALGRDVLSVECDVAEQGSVDNLAAEARKRFGAVHLLCNNAGVMGTGEWDGPLDVWHRVLGVNLYGVVHGVRTFLPLMTQQGVGHIVNTASMAGLTALPGAAPYCVSKHGVVGLSESLYLELLAIDSPIGVSCLCPGFVRTDLVSRHDNAGARGIEPTDSVSANTFELLRDGIASGVDPSIVSQKVLNAVLQNRFWILTHREGSRSPVARMRRAARQENPTYGPESRHPELSRLRDMLRSALLR